MLQISPQDIYSLFHSEQNVFDILLPDIGRRVGKFQKKDYFCLLVSFFTEQYSIVVEMWGDNITIRREGINSGEVDCVSGVARVGLSLEPLWKSIWFYGHI